MQTSGGCRDVEFFALTLSWVSYSSCTLSVVGTTFHETFCMSPFTVLTTRDVKSREAHADLAVAVSAFGKGLYAYTGQSKDMRPA